MRLGSGSKPSSRTCALPSSYLFVIYQIFVVTSSRCAELTDFMGSLEDNMGALQELQFIGMLCVYIKSI